MNPALLSRRALLAGGVALAGMAGARAGAATGGVRVALLGQSLIQQDMRARPWPGMAALRARLARSAVIFTDLETAIGGERAGPPTRDSNVLHAADPAVLDCLAHFGVNLVATANNHAWDLGTGGIMAAIDALDRRDIAHAGTGRTIGEASAPGRAPTPDGTVALVAAAAGAIRPGAAASASRAGVNELRRNPDGTPDREDVARNLAAIRLARAQGATVLACLHNHYWEADPAITPGWQRDYARQCVDAGAAAFVAHGPPQLQGIERYRGAPLFHGLGNFFFQTRKPDGSYGPEAWRSLLVEAVFAGGRFAHARLIPIQLATARLSADADAPVSGVPAIARRHDARETINALKMLSARLDFRIEGTDAEAWLS